MPLSKTPKYSKPGIPGSNKKKPTPNSLPVIYTTDMINAVVASSAFTAAVNSAVTTALANAMEW